MSTEHSVTNDIPEELNEPVGTWRDRDLAVEDYLALLIFWALALDVFAQFFSRYVLGSSLTWTEEVARYLLVSLAFIGAARGVRRNSHIAVELFHSGLSTRVAFWLMRVVDLLSAGLMGYMAYLSWVVGQRTMGTMFALPLPRAWLYYVVMVGFALMLVRTLIRMAHNLQTLDVADPTEARID